MAIGGQVVSVQGLAGRYDDLFLSLFGDHQAQNATLAIAAVESFLGDGKQPLAHELLAEGLATATSPGRLQILGLEPTVLVDAAHNPHGAKALAAALPAYFAFDEITLVLGILADKDVRGILTELGPLVDRVHVTRSSSERAIPVDELADRVDDWVHGKPELRFESLSEAIAEAREWASLAPRRAVLVTGSITLVGQAIALAAEEGWGR
jgi:dihydrofolate synthase / folylpolyglutamate synthase